MKATIKLPLSEASTGFSSIETELQDVDGKGLLEKVEVIEIRIFPLESTIHVRYRKTKHYQDGSLVDGFVPTVHSYVTEDVPEMGTIDMVAGVEGEAESWKMPLNEDGTIDMSSYVKTTDESLAATNWEAALGESIRVPTVARLVAQEGYAI